MRSSRKGGSENTAASLMQVRDTRSVQNQSCSESTESIMAQSDSCQTLAIEALPGEAQVEDSGSETHASQQSRSNPQISTGWLPEFSLLENDNLAANPQQASSITNNVDTSKRLGPSGCSTSNGLCKTDVDNNSAGCVKETTQLEIDGKHISSLGLNCIDPDVCTAEPVAQSCYKDPSGSEKMQARVSELELLVEELQQVILSGCEERASLHRQLESRQGPLVKAQGTSGTSLPCSIQRKAWCQSATQSILPKAKTICRLEWCAWPYAG